MSTIAASTRGPNVLDLREEITRRITQTRAVANLLMVDENSSGIVNDAAWLIESELDAIAKDFEELEKFISPRSRRQKRKPK